MEVALTIRPHEGYLRSRCFDLGEVVGENIDEDGSIRMNLRIEQKNLARLSSIAGLNLGEASAS